MNKKMNSNIKSLDTQLQEFQQRRFMAMPLSGTLVWALLILTGWLLPPSAAVMAIYIGTGSIVYIAMGMAKLTGENFKFEKGANRNFFDTLFLATVGMSFMVYAIAIPFFLTDYRSLPFTVAVLTGLMWLPISVMMQNWIGVVHAVGRTLLCTAAWFLYPELSFVLQPVIVVGMYGVSLTALQRRWQHMQQNQVVVAATA
jgi:hypothetical protein